jgi:hypothetical protein
LARSLLGLFEVSSRSCYEGVVGTKLFTHGYWKRTSRLPLEQNRRSVEVADCYAQPDVLKVVVGDNVSGCHFGALMKLIQGSLCKSELSQTNERAGPRDKRMVDCELQPRVTGLDDLPGGEIQRLLVSSEHN